MNKHAPLAVLALVALVGCGSPDPVNETHTGELATGDPVHTQDNSFYDEYKVEAGEGYTITVTMQSTAVDPYLHLFGPEGDQLAMNDDMAPGNTTAQIVHTAPAKGTYTIWANSLNAGETGAYTVTIQTAKGN